MTDHMLPCPSCARLEAERDEARKERDHERHEKDTVADTIKAYGRWSKAERSRLGVEVARLTAQLQEAQQALQAEKVVSQEHFDYWQRAESQLTALRGALHQAEELARMVASSRQNVGMAIREKAYAVNDACRLADAVNSILSEWFDRSVVVAASHERKDERTDRIGYCQKCKIVEWWDQYTICTRCRRSLMLGDVETVERSTGKRRPPDPWPANRISVKAERKDEP